MALLRFDDIIGHEGVIDRLRRNLEGDHLAHAYLFIGPNGIGKASIARLLGAGTLCRSTESIRPCGECLPCGKIARRNHPDFHELTPEASKRWIRVDQVRELQTALTIRPFDSNRRVVIVDGSEQMNEAAQNAFLKTLEEPPSGTLIVMTATGVHQLLPTIVSRCRIERFGPLKSEDLANILIDKRDIDKNEALLLAGLSSGSLGAALSMDLDFVRRIRPAIIRRIARIAIDKQASPEKIMGLSNQLTALGEDSLVLIRMLLTDVASRKLSRDRIINSDQGEILDRLGKQWNIKTVAGLFEKTIEVEEGLARNLQKTFLFENLLFSFARGGLK